MRTASIEINGITYPLCFSTRVIRDCTERYGDIDQIGAALKDEDKVKALDEALWILARMMDAGTRYAHLQGEEAPEPLSMDMLYDLCDISDFANLNSKIAETVVNGRQTTIETVNEKNAKATLEQA